MSPDSLAKLAAAATAISSLLRELRPSWRLLLDFLRSMRPPVSYETISLDIVLDIEDAGGRRAIYERRQRVRFLAVDSGVVRDLVWGEGDPLARYTATGARRLAVQPDGSRKVVLLGLARRPQRGERVSIRSRRVIINGLTQRQEYCEVLVERPTCRLSMRVLFPRSRPPRDAVLLPSTGGMAYRVPVRYGADGRPVLCCSVKKPVPERIYSLRWSW
jgi:hypothetical protein